jgi:hypothetical protein
VPRWARILIVAVGTVIYCAVGLAVMFWASLYDWIYLNNQCDQCSRNAGHFSAVVIGLVALGFVAGVPAGIVWIVKTPSRSRASGDDR